MSESKISHEMKQLTLAIVEASNIASRLVAKMRQPEPALAGKVDLLRSELVREAAKAADILTALRRQTWRPAATNRTAS